MHRLSPRALGLTFTIALVAVIALYAVMAPLEVAMQARGHGILDLEFAWTAETFASIVRDWGADTTAAARTQIMIDFAFIPAYGLAVASAVEWACRRMPSARRWLPALAPVAMAADVLENLAMLQGLGRDAPAWSAPVASTAATIKFAFLAVALLAVLVVAGIRWRRRAGRGSLAR